MKRLWLLLLLVVPLGCQKKQDENPAENSKPPEVSVPSDDSTTSTETGSTETGETMPVAKVVVDVPGMS